MRRSPAAALSDTRWLKRLRRELSGSGRRRQAALLLARQDGGEADRWDRCLHGILRGEETPDPDLILRLESLLARPHVVAPPPDQTQFAFGELA